MKRLRYIKRNWFFNSQPHPGFVFQIHDQDYIDIGLIFPSTKVRMSNARNGIEHLAKLIVKYFI